MPVVEAFPGWVYGPGSWFAEYVLQPLHAGKRVTGLSGRARITSLVHVGDCATGFVPAFPTYADGVPDAVATWLRETAAPGGQRTAEIASSA